MHQTNRVISILPLHLNSPHLPEQRERHENRKAATQTDTHTHRASKQDGQPMRMPAGKQYGYRRRMTNFISRLVIVESMKLAVEKRAPSPIARPIPLSSQCDADHEPERERERWEVEGRRKEKKWSSEVQGNAMWGVGGGREREREGSSCWWGLCCWQVVCEMTLPSSPLGKRKYLHTYPFCPLAPPNFYKDFR